MDTHKFVGHLDGIQNGELYGWALDVAAPLLPLKIAVHIDGRITTEALAVYYRPDVAKALECSGQNGFYVDLNQLCRGEGIATIDVRTPDGASLPGAPLSYPRIPANGSRSKGPTLLFMHLPKTAGTAFRDLVLANYKQSEIGYIYGDPPGFPSRNLRDLPLEQRSQLNLVFGHFGYGLHDQIPNECQYTTLLRDPVRRVWSHYNHLLRRGDPVAFENGRPKSVEALLENRLTVDLDNLIVRHISGYDVSDLPPGSVTQEVYESAKTHLQHFVCIGHQENLAAAYDLLANRFAWVPGLRCYNRRDALPGASRPTPLQESAIRHFNEWDLRLYDDILNARPSTKA